MGKSASRHLVSPDLLGFLDLAPPLVLSEEILPVIRQGFSARVSAPEDPEAVNAVDVSVIKIDGKVGDPAVDVVLYRPKAELRGRGAILHMHGGGFISGNASALAPLYRKLAWQLDCVIVSVDYRLAPETRYPGAIEDCYAALGWLMGQAKLLGLDTDRIGVMGESAGGGLAAALAILARDRGEYALAFQHLVYPMLDDRTCVALEPHPYAGEFVWTLDSNRFGWRALLGAEPGGADVPPYAAPARCESLKGLPPAFINTGALDLFVEEDVSYAQRLIRDGVPAELHVYPGAFHGFHFVRDAAVTQRAQRDSVEALRRALAG